MHPELTQFNDWLNCQYPHSSVRKHYMSDLTLFFSWAEKPPSAIRFHDVDEYTHHCLSKGLSPLTINRRLSSLRTLYYFLSIVNNVSIQCPVIPKRHFLRKPQPLPRDASEEQIKSIFAHVHNPRNTAMFTLMLECGLRVGEVRNLSIDDVLLDDPPRLRIHGKGDKHRIAYLSPPTKETLNNWLASRPTTKSRAVFINQHDKGLSVSGIQFILNEYCCKAGITETVFGWEESGAKRFHLTKGYNETVSVCRCEEGTCSSRRSNLPFATLRLLRLRTRAPRSDMLMKSSYS